MAASKDKTFSVLVLTGNFMNEFMSIIVFAILDLIDFLLCYTYRVVDFTFEAGWKPCYCSSAGEALASRHGETKTNVCFLSTKFQLEGMSDTLYTRSSLLSEISKLTSVSRLKTETNSVIQRIDKFIKGRLRSTNFDIIEMLQGRIVGQQSHPVPRWSDCDCQTCNAWSFSTGDTLFLKAEGTLGNLQFFICAFVLLVDSDISTLCIR